MTCRRALLATIVATVAFAAIPASASAATYFVDESGDDGGGTNDCLTELNPCATIQHAIDEHRLAPEPDDVIEIAEGEYEQNFETEDPVDAGLTISGELDGDGFPTTVVSGSDDGLDPCVCIVNLGATGGTLENIEVSQDGTDVGENVRPIRVTARSRLTTVDVPELRESTLAAVEVGCPSGMVIEDSLIDTSGFNTRAIQMCTNLTLEDSTVVSGGSLAIQQSANGAGLKITRSFVGADPGNSDPVVQATNLSLDSSVVAGGSVGARVSASAATVDVNNSTVDTGVPGDEDSGEGLLLDLAGPVDVDVDSSILLEPIVADAGSGTVTCGYTNFPGSSFTDNTGNYTDECPDPGTPGSTNSDLLPMQMFVGPDPSLPLGFDFSLTPGSPAIDGGKPGPVPPGFSTTDFFEEPRVQAKIAANCPAGIRDKGAIETSGVACVATLTVAPDGTGNGTVTGPGINCGGGSTDCSETVAIGASIALTATAANGSAFEGFSGGGCSASPCTVTMDAGKTVRARFTNTAPDQRTLTVQKTGAGEGTITGPGIDCGGAGHTDCSQAYPRGEVVALEATAARGSVFGRFSGSGCEASPCSLTMDGSRAVVGRFEVSEGPRTTFAKRPRRATRKPVFKLESSQPDSTFECKVDRGAWEECGPRVKLRGLKAGRHKLKARATNARDVTGPANVARFRVSRRR